MLKKSKHSTYARLLLVFAAGLLLGIGLCGIDFLLASRGIGKSTEEFGVGPLDGISLVTMLLSALGLVLTVAAWVLSRIVGASTGKRSDLEPIRLFDKEGRDE